VSKPRPLRDLWAWFYWGLFLVVVPLVALWMARKPVPQVSLPVPARDLPAYHVITAGDLTTAFLPVRQVPDEAVRNAQDLVGRYTLQALPAGEPVRRAHVVAIPDPALITDTLAVGIPADRAAILGGALRPGDVVAVAAVPASDVAVPVRVFDAVLVLDVKHGEEGSVVVLAIPAGRWLEYLARVQNAAIVLARRVE
jgi:Flp pilus assembly protein CpaB